MADDDVLATKHLDALAVVDAVADEVEGALLAEVADVAGRQVGGAAVVDDPFEVAVGDGDVGANLTKRISTVVTLP